MESFLFYILTNSKTFEDIKHIDENGIEYWYARELMEVLSYKDLRYFDAVIEKAKIACQNSEITDIDHFVVSNKMVQMQIKSTSCIGKSRNYQVALKSCGGTNGKTYKTLIETNIDEVFILLENMEIYIIPIEKIKNKSTLIICKKSKKFLKQN